MSSPQELAHPGRMPVLFAGHGSPMNAVEDNAWSRGFRQLGAELPRPRAILSVSAHWFVPGVHLTASAAPETLHDFGGFPQELYRVRYPAPGDPALASRAAERLAPFTPSLADDRGLDHGTWSVLLHAFPAADIPIVQLSIDRRRPPEEHLAMGRSLAPLRDEGVLILASGNIVHNLSHAMTQFRTPEPQTPSWAAEFDASVARALEAGNREFLVGALSSPEGSISHPTPDHYLPLLYAVGASEPGEAVRFPIAGFDLGSLSMRAAIFG